MLNMNHSSTPLQIMGFLMSFFVYPQYFHTKITALSSWAPKLKDELLSFTNSPFLRNPRPNYSHQKPVVHSGKEPLRGTG